MQYFDLMDAILVEYRDIPATEFPCHNYSIQTADLSKTLFQRGPLIMAWSHALYKKFQWVILKARDISPVRVCERFRAHCGCWIHILLLWKNKKNLALLLSLFCWIEAHFPQYNRINGAKVIHESIVMSTPPKPEQSNQNVNNRKRKNPVHVMLRHIKNCSPL